MFKEMQGINGNLTEFNPLRDLRPIFLIPHSSFLIFFLTFAL
jgi:hypothetical protein